MDPFLIIGVVVLALGALYFIVARPTRNRPLGGRSDEHERPELTGTEQYKHRKLP